MLSVVMPIYNTAPEMLERSIKSLMVQTFRDMEIILVDDGSGEETCRKLDELASQDACIKVIHQKNRGVSVARNTGIQAAQGRYLTMMDSDDVIAPEAYGKVIRRLQKTGADAAVFGFRRISSDGAETRYPVLVGNRPALESAERINTIIAASAVKRGGGYPWNKVWDLEKIGKAELFAEGIICYEDKLWCMQMYQKCRKILLMPEIWYTYYENYRSLSKGDSISREEAIKKRRSALAAYDRILEILPKTGIAYYVAAAFRLKTVVMGILKHTI